MQYLCATKEWFGCQCLGFLMCAQMLIHAIAHGGCADNVRVCTWSRLWEKNPLPHLGLGPAWILCLAVESNALLLPYDFRQGTAMAQNTLPSPTTCSFYQDTGLAGTTAPTFLGLQTFPVHLPTSNNLNWKVMKTSRVVRTVLFLLLLTNNSHTTAPEVHTRIVVFFF